jgi:hypothetical protein
LFSVSSSYLLFSSAFLAASALSELSSFSFIANSLVIGFSGVS